MNKLLNTIRIHEGLLQICTAVAWSNTLGRIEQWQDLVDYYDKTVAVSIPDDIKDRALLPYYCSLKELRNHKEQTIKIKQSIVPLE